jgi:hypothetical protein
MEIAAAMAVATAGEMEIAAAMAEVAATVAGMVEEGKP